MFFRSAIAICVLALTAATALADLPGGRSRRPPRPDDQPKPAAVSPTKTSMPVTVKREDLSKEGKKVQAKIAIPRKLLARLAPGEVPAASAPADRQSSLPWWSTIIAGVALSAGAVAFVFVARRNKPARAMVAASLAVSLLAGGYAFANLALPDRPLEEEMEATIILEILDDGDAVVLTLPST